MTTHHFDFWIDSNASDEAIDRIHDAFLDQVITEGLSATGIVSPQDPEASETIEEALDTLMEALGDLHESVNEPRDCPMCARLKKAKEANRHGETP